MIRTIICFAYVVAYMIFIIPIGILGFILHIIGFKKFVKRYIYVIEIAFGFSVMKIAGCKVELVGLENIPKKDGICFVSNHDGYFDIVFLLAYSKHTIGFVAKKELSYVPFLNMWIYIIGGLFIDRRSVKRASATISRGVEKIKAGSNLVIFPEGSRSRGRGLQVFHPGSLKLATLAEATIVPVAIQGSADIWEKTGRVRKTNVKITFCEPIETSGLPPEDRKVVLCEKIKAVIKEKLEI
jgi:1-acyl-sn-glycerol-3-phosphate acyltransferase